METTHTSTVVAITGASAGVGRATARAFARTGASLALMARGSEGLEATAEEVRALGGQAMTIDLDVSDANAVDDAATAIERKFGPIDVWVNNAMVTVFGPVAELDAAEVARVTEVTYLGAVWGTMAALRRMKKSDRGVIIQVGSALAYRAIPLQAAYCAAKHALRAFTDSVRCELIHDKSNVRITTVHLPAMNTPQFTWGRSHMEKQAQPVPPIYAPEIAARTIVEASQRDRREFYVGWPTVKAILGNRLVPGILDHYLADAAWDGQLADRPEVAPEEDNAFTPVDSDHGAHGLFDSREKQPGLLDRTSERLGVAGMQAAMMATGLAAVVAATAAVVKWMGRQED